MSSTTPARPKADQNPVTPARPLLVRPILHDTVVDHLREMIVEGELPAGSRINERELCELLGISRTPLREAVKVLAAEGLVDITPNRGASVAEMSRSDVMDAFELMSGLEALAGELACERITDAELAELQKLHNEMTASRNREDLSGYYSRNRQIHSLIIQATRNSALRQVYETTNRRLHALRFRSNFNTEKWDRALAEHEAIICALTDRDAPRLSALLKQHLLYKRDVILADMQARQESGTP